MKTKNIVIGGMLTGLAIMIPLIFGGTPLMIVIPPGFTATIASHLPSMLAMAISPGVAIMVGVGSALGFTLRVSAVVGARALTHSVFGGIGALAYENGMPFWAVLLITTPIHALSEALILLPFGFDFYQALVVTGVGTAIHHLIDSAITLTVYHSLVHLSILKKPSLQKRS
ncbi:MAG: ECF transporter S component [Clostridiales bacterium]|jgi:niacin transporter|nr:ECF transporter S component [Clostridiales bacterium]